MKSIKFTLFYIVACLHLNAYALSTDMEQPIHIQADRVEVDDRQGVSTYTGSVQLTQGSMTLEADNLVVYTQDRKLKRVVATGSPAQFSQRPDKSQEDVTATASLVEYMASSGLLVLRENAHLQHGANTFNGNTIEYETRRDYVRAASTEDKQERVQVIIQPETLPR
jgi:lipopolysaccharide export system protein LptA